MRVIDNYFKITGRNSTIPRELVGGAVTFASMVYILAVQPGVMAAAGMDSGAVFTATAFTAGMATLIMAFLGRAPIALASGLGINAFIAYSVCGQMGFSWQTALCAVFVEGLIFIAISLTGLREIIIAGIPDQVKKAVALGIGLFVAIIGFNNAGILITNGPTPLAMAPINSGPPLLTVIGLVFIIILWTLRIPGSILISICATALVGIPMGITVIPENFSLIHIPPMPYTPVDIIQGIAGVHVLDFCLVLFSLLFVDLFDTVSTLAGVAIQGNLLDKQGNIINCRKILLSDALGTSIGALFGATTVTAYIESTTGVAVGGRTGLSSVVTGLLFLLALFTSPFFLLIPSAATAPALIFVGFMMLGALTGLELRKTEVGLPVFLTMIAVPLSYSIAQGLAWGFISFTLVKIVQRRFFDITPPTMILTVIFLIKQLL
ncbi:MAG: NCS2 family permease [Spirochaetaceae bacterium]|jgi:AGZA family xanthine/uracil permease-like MFS transporter|nr:NCS2 family permease [Spirochaetaceae bacterium]